MADKMEFPEKIEDFLCGYSFQDTEEVYTNGAMLIPVFRVKQALEHYSAQLANKVIDNFVHRLKVDYVNFDMYDILQNNQCKCPHASLKSYNDMIDEIANDLKAGE